MVPQFAQIARGRHSHQTVLAALQVLPQKETGKCASRDASLGDGYGSNSQTSTNKSSAHGLNGSLLACRLCSPKTGDR